MKKKKIILLTQGTYGDVHPFVGLGLELNRRGHEVVLAANGYYRDLIQKEGLEFVELGSSEEFQKAIEVPIFEHHPIKSFEWVYKWLILPFIERAYRIIEERYIAGETLVVAHGIVFGARVAQEKLSVPLATVHLAPICLRSASDPATWGGALGWMPVGLQRMMLRIADRLTEKQYGRQVNTFRSTLGLKPVKTIFCTWADSPELIIVFFPSWFAAKQEDWPVQTKQVGFPLYDERGLQPMQAEIEEFLEPEERPIVFTSSSGNIQVRKFFEESLKACEMLGKRAILLTRHDKQVPGALPAWARHFAYAPFSELLPRSAALVHIGGIGSIAQALAAGCPQLIMPMGFDQFDNAERVKRLGVGDVVSSKRYCGRAVAHKLEDLLARIGLAEKCEKIRALTAKDRGLEKACEIIEQLGGSE